MVVSFRVGADLKPESSRRTPDACLPLPSSLSQPLLKYSFSCPPPCIKPLVKESHAYLATWNWVRIHCLFWWSHFPLYFLCIIYLIMLSSLPNYSLTYNIPLILSSVLSFLDLQFWVPVTASLFWFNVLLNILKLIDFPPTRSTSCGMSGLLSAERCLLILIGVEFLYFPKAWNF